MSEDSAELVYLPLGGAGEIGMNCYLYGYGPPAARRWIVVDLGIGFGDMETAPGVELILPDTAVLRQARDRVEAIFVTHAHEDHLGAIAHLWAEFAVPVYARAFSAEILRRKFGEAGLDLTGIHEVGAQQGVEAGPFTVSFLPITHSVPEASALVIETPLGRIVHTGDFKLDPDPQLGPAIDLGPFEAAGDAGVLALACDSTNVFLEGQSGSEVELLPALTKLMAEAEGAVAATTFASNVARLRTLARVAADAGRSIVVAGRAMRRMIDAAVETGILTDFPPMVREDDAADIPRANLFYLVTGSQGEARAAVARIASGTHPSVKLRPGDVMVFSSKTIPGNESGVIRAYNRLSEQGVRVIDGDMARIHVSGHARRDDLARMYAAVRPALSIPMHGEHRHLVEHARSAPGWGAGAAHVVPNGSILRLAPGPAEIVGSAETGRVYLDGQVRIGALDGVIRERLKAARQGIVLAVLFVDDDGDLLADVEVRCIGTPKTNPDWREPLDELIAQEIEAAVDNAPRALARRDKDLEELVARVARKTASRLLGKKPLLQVVLSRAESDPSD